MRIPLSAPSLPLRDSYVPLTKDDIPHPIDTRQGGGYFYFKMIFGTVDAASLTLSCRRP